MLALTRSIQYIARGRWYVVGALAVALAGAAGPGQVITLIADCYWSTTKGGPVLHSTTENYLVVQSPVLSAARRPVFLTNVGPKPTKLPSGKIIMFRDDLAAGMVVWTYAWDNGQVVLVEGVLTSDGRVIVDGRALERAQGPNG